MKRLLVITMVAVMSATMSAPVFAAKKSSSTQKKTSDVVTHEELGSLLANILGLAKFLPANPSSQDVFNALTVNGISPEGGWVVGESVNRATLARVVVQALGAESEVKKPNDPNSWIAYLKTQGVAIDTVGQAADSLDPLMNPVVESVEFASTTDPLVKPEDTSGRPPLTAHPLVLTK